MSVTELLSQIDAEISLLHEVRALLAGAGNGTSRGGDKTKRKHTMSAEARARISAAQKKRWAKWKKAEK